MNCEGCGYALTTGAETFGGIGQTFCFDCWQEEVLLVAERDHAWKQWDAAEQSRFDARIEFWANEYDSLTVANRRRYKVIGRAA